MAAVQLKEFNEQNTDVNVGTADVLPVVELDGGEWRKLLAANIYIEFCLCFFSLNYGGFTIKSGKFTHSN